MLTTQFQRETTTIITDSNTLQRGSSRSTFILVHCYSFSFRNHYLLRHPGTVGGRADGVRNVDATGSGKASRFAVVQTLEPGRERLKAAASCTAIARGGSRGGQSFDAGAAAAEGSVFGQVVDARRYGRRHRSAGDRALDTRRCDQ